jgi:hypothetical protein
MAPGQAQHQVFSVRPGNGEHAAPKQTGGPVHGWLIDWSSGEPFEMRFETA